MSDSDLIKTLKSLIEKELLLQEGNSLKQRDFEYLSEVIFQKANISLSVSTLKRVWKGNGDHNPQVVTLNALVNLLDYESWNDFKKEQLSKGVPKAQRQLQVKPQTRIPIYVYFAGAFILVALTFFLLNNTYVSKNRFDPDKIIFKSKKSVSVDVPNTVVFEYDISQIQFDSAFIQHSWDENRRARLSRDNHFESFIYYFPGYHTAKLILNDQIVKKERVHITTDGWAAIVSVHPSEAGPRYIDKPDMMVSNQMHVSKQVLFENEINFNNKHLFVNFFNVRDFGELNGDNFSLETRLKNSPQDGGNVCQFTQIIILCENGRISIPLCKAGCEAKARLHVGEIFKRGKTNDLTAFGGDLSSWRDLRISVKDKNLGVHLDGKHIYRLTFTKDLGKVVGLHYEFYGCGAVDSVKLFDLHNKEVYSENFDQSIN